MGLFSLHEECFICHKDTGFDKNKTPYGYICRKCLDILSKHGINLLTIKRYSVSELQSIISSEFIQSPEEGLSIKERAKIKMEEMQKN